jgi:hypothetical protein
MGAYANWLKAMRWRSDRAAHALIEEWEARVREARPDAAVVRDGTSIRVSGARLMRSLIEEPRLRFAPELKR